MRLEHTLLDGATAAAGGGTATANVTDVDVPFPDSGEYEYVLYVDGGSNATNDDVDVTKEIESHTEDFEELAVSGADISGGKAYKLDVQEAIKVNLTITNNESSTGNDHTVYAYLVIRQVWRE